MNTDSRATGVRVGIVGAGHIGGALAATLPRVGHPVLLANSRGPESLRELVAKLGPGVQAATVAEAATADIVVVTVPLRALTALSADQFAGRIVVDTCNYYPQRDGVFAELEDGSMNSSELVAAHLSNSTVVKAFNTIYFERLANEGSPELPLDQRLAIPVASDDAAAKALVSGIISELGFAPVDGGTLADSWRQEPGQPVYNQPVGPAEAQRIIDTTG
ncbi:MAG: NAD(P)-binding domain-containing protein [Actinomycetes bacterium]